MTSAARSLECQSERTLAELHDAFTEFQAEIARLRATNDALAAAVEPPSDVSGGTA
jgi:uncharacterized coiled-coil protein SlyX